MPWKIDLGDLGKTWLIASSNSGNMALISQDGLSWQEYTGPGTTFEYAETFLNNQVSTLAAIDGAIPIVTTDDTIANFSNGSFVPALNGNVNRIDLRTYGNGLVALGIESVADAYSLFTSQNGITWTKKLTSSWSGGAQSPTAPSGVRTVMGSSGVMSAYVYRWTTGQQQIRVFRGDPEGSMIIGTNVDDITYDNKSLKGVGFAQSKYLLSYGIGTNEYLKYGSLSLATEISVPVFFHSFIETPDGIVGVGPSGIYKSLTADITTWTWKHSGAFNDIRYFDGKLFAVGNSSLIAYSTDEGETWTNISHGLSSFNLMQLCQFGL